jgi:hypothetical protein
MRKKMLLGMAVAVLLCVVGWTSYAQRSNPSKVSYEYQVMADPTEIMNFDEGVKKLNELGAQGWELVGVAGPSEHSGTRLYFRRIKE